MSQGVCAIYLHQFRNTFPSYHFVSTFVQMVHETVDTNSSPVQRICFVNIYIEVLEIISTVTNRNQVTLVATTTMLPTLKHSCQQDKPEPQFRSDMSPWLYTLLHSGVAAEWAAIPTPHEFCPEVPLPRHWYPTVHCQCCHHLHRQPGSVFNVTLQSLLDVQFYKHVYDMYN
jgi:hypothetical protein